MKRAPLWLLALNVTLLMQVTASILAQAMPVLGPTLTGAAGVAPEAIGHLSAMLSLGALWFLASGHVLLPRWGAVRVLQAGGLIGAAALALALTGSWTAMMASALLIGVCYGPAPPAASDILMRHSPPNRRALIFSIKQAGAPFGGAAAGLLLPYLAGSYGWRWALIVIAAISAIASIAVEVWRAPIDFGREPAQGNLLRALLAPRTIVLPFQAIAARRSLRWLAGTGFSFACVQGCLFSFYVTYLHTKLGVSLAAAGSAFAMMLALGMASRVAVGFVADWLGSSVRMLIVLGAGSSVSALLMTAFAASWPWALILAASGFIGCAAASWNGIYLAEVARLAPEGRVSEATSATTLLTFLGYVIAPAGVASLTARLGSYEPGFIAIAALPIVSIAMLLRVRALDDTSRIG